MKYYDTILNFGDRVAAIENTGRKITYAQIAQTAERLDGIMPKRSLVFSLCRNVIGSMCGYLSFLHNRSVPLMLDANIDPVLLGSLTDIYKPAYLYVPEDMAEKFSDYEKVYEGWDYVLLKTNFDITYALSDDLGLLLATSGSTGSPKLVRQSYANVCSNAKAIVEYLEIDENERPITTLPMNYTYGLSIINSHVAVGATVLLTTDTVIAKGFWDFMKAENATSFGGVPYTYEMLKRIRFFRMDIPSLKYFTQAGGKLSAELHKEFAEFAESKGMKFIVMYGQTEATARMAYLPADKAIEKYGSMGIAIPGGEFVLTDVDGNPITEPDVVGELVYKGPNVTLGYATEQADLAKGDERGGVLVTGDMAKMDEEGFFYIVGRKKRFLKIYGNRVNLDETERMVKRRFEQMECACTGVDDHMEVYITSQKAEDREAVEAYLREQTRLQGKAFTVYSIREIPKNEAGKTLYKDLKPEE